MAVGDVYESRLVVQHGDQLGINVLHYLITAQTGGGASAQAAANHLGPLLSNPLKFLFGPNSIYRGIGIRKIFPAPVGPEAINTAGQGGGSASGDVMPRQVAGILTKRTALAGRSFRGRVYIMFPTEDDNTPDGFPGAQYLLEAAAYAQAIALSQNIVAVPPAPPGDQSTFTPCVWSRFTLSATPITSVITRPRWGTQRRRGSYGRQNVAPF